MKNRICLRFPRLEIYVDCDDPPQKTMLFAVNRACLNRVFKFIPWTNFAWHQIPSCIVNVPAERWIDIGRQSSRCNQAQAQGSAYAETTIGMIVIGVEDKKYRIDQLHMIFGPVDTVHTVTLMGILIITKSFDFE